MSFESMMLDTIDLLKKDGTRTLGIKASVQQRKIITFDTSTQIEPHDLLMRRTSNGQEETYEIIDPVFFEEFGGIPSSYQIEVKKLGVPEARQHVQSITYNVTGAGARVNSHSTDNSVNTINTGSQTLSYVEDIRKALAAESLSPEQTADAADIVKEIEQQIEGGKPNKSVLKALIGALPQIASIVSAGASILAQVG